VAGAGNPDRDRRDLYRHRDPVDRAPSGFNKEGLSPATIRNVTGGSGRGWILEQPHVGRQSPSTERIAIM